MALPDTFAASWPAGPFSDNSDEGPVDVVLLPLQEVCLVVCELLRVNSILQALYLDGNRLGAQGGGHLVRAAQSSSSLYTLSFRDCDLSKTGLASRNHSR